MLPAAYLLLLALNTLWFGAGFQQFCMRSRKMAKGLVAEAHRRSPLVDVLAGNIRFLGGLNASLGLLNLLLLVLAPTLFRQAPERAALLACFGVAHASQFLVNLPIAWRERAGQPTIWPVRKGMMWFIFCVDGVLMLVNLALAGVLLGGA